MSPDQRKMSGQENRTSISNSGDARSTFYLFFVLLGFAVILLAIGYIVMTDLDRASVLCLQLTQCYGARNATSVLSNLRQASTWLSIGTISVGTGLVAGSVAGIVSHFKPRKRQQ